MKTASLLTRIKRLERKPTPEAPVDWDALLTRIGTDRPTRTPADDIEDYIRSFDREVVPTGTEGTPTLGRGLETAVADLTEEELEVMGLTRSNPTEEEDHE